MKKVITSISNLFEKKPVQEKFNAPALITALARIGSTITEKKTENPNGSTPKIAFIIDATASRGVTWKTAQDIQAAMFQRVEKKTGIQLNLKVTFFRSDEVNSSEWLTQSSQLIDFMAPVECKAGITQIAKALAVYVREYDLKAICLIGDCAEDSPADIEIIARLIGARGVRVFCFLEGNNSQGKTVFKMIASLTHGAFASFNSKADLSELCNFVATFAAKGAAGISELLAANSKRPQLENMAKQLAITYQKGG